MPNVPTTPGFDIQSEPLPTPFQQAPPASAAPFQAGAERGDLSEQISRIAEHERQLAIGTKVEDAKDQFLQTAIKTRDSYLALNGQDALAGYDKALGALNSARQQLAAGMGTQSGAREFRAGTDTMFAREASVIESHLVNQRKSFYAQVDKGLLTTHIQDLSSLGAAGASPGHIQSSWNDTEADVRKSVARQGYSGDDAETLVQQRLAGPAHALIKSMADAKSPHLRDAMDRYGKYVSPTVLEGANKALDKQVADAAVHQVVSSAPLVNYDTDPKTGKLKEDPDGTPDTSAVLKNLRTVLDSDKYTDAQKDSIEKGVQSRLSLEKQIWTDRGVQLGAKVSAQAMSLGGFDLRNASEVDKEQLRVTAPLTLEMYARNQRTEMNALDSADRKAASDASGANFKLLQANLADMDEDKLLKLKPQDLIHMQADKQTYPGGFTRADQKAAGPLLTALQKQHKEANLSWTVKASEDAVSSLFPQHAEKGGGGLSALHKEPLYTNMLADINEAVQAGTLKKSDPVGLKKFVDSKLATVEPEHFWSKRRRQVEIDAEERASRADDAEREANFGAANPGSSDLPPTALPKRK